MSFRLIFLVDKLLTTKKEEVLGRRHKFIRFKDCMVTEEMLDHLACQQGDLLLKHYFLDIRKTRGTVELLVKWKGRS